MEPLRTIFMGTPEFAVPSLSSLLDDKDFDVVAVVTQTDKKVGRRHAMTPPPIKELAEKNGLRVMQPAKIRDISDEIRSLRPDLIVVVAYGKIIPGEILDMPKYGCVNVHGSLLPKHRGAACIQAAIMSGDEKTGITIMKMDEGLDTGPILSQAEITIQSTDDASALHDKLSILGAEKLPTTIKDFINGKIKPIPQDDNSADYIGLLKKDDGRIAWSMSADRLERFIRAMHPWPGAWTTIEDQVLIIKKSQISSKKADDRAGLISLIDNELTISCGDGAIEILELQLAGKKTSSARDFIQGHKNFIGKIFK